MADVPAGLNRFKGRVIGDYFEVANPNQLDRCGEREITERCQQSTRPIQRNHSAKIGVGNGDTPNGNGNGNGNGQTRSATNGSQTLTVTFRRSGDLDRDKFRLKELYERIRDPRGRDRFAIQLESKGESLKLVFPDDPCTVNERLTSELVKHFRVEVSVAR